MGYNDKTIKNTSKFLSYVLRHKPDSIGLSLDEHGWAKVSDLLKQAKSHGRDVDIDLLKEVVANNDKKRFEFSQNSKHIRASQGHSIKIDLELKSTVPPDVLYHGTAVRNLSSIFANGINAGNRHHVHLSTTIETARSVGGRHGKPIALEVDSRRMHEDGFEFMCSANGVWLTAHIPSGYFKVMG